MTAALAVGLARRALDDAAAYAGQRVAFGRPIGEHQAVQHRLADMAVAVHAARLVTNSAAAALDGGSAAAAHEASMAKLFATEACAEVVDGCTRVLGSYGFADDYGAQRYFRDARFLLYGGGTSELLRSMIGRVVLRSHAAPGSAR
jgi:alkylation response protein AidB-like acyl-CoA dehydrogenase